eukprot:976966_1
MIRDLPTDIVIKVLSFIDIIELCRNQRISHFFQSCIECALRNLEIVPGCDRLTVLEGIRQTILNRCRNVRYIRQDMWWTMLPSKPFARVLDRCPLLEFDASCHLFPSVMMAGGVYPNLRYLELCTLSLSAGARAQAVKFSEKFPGIALLRLRLNFEVQEHADFLCDMLRGSVNLKRLELTLDESDMSWHRMAHLPQLREVVLDGHADYFGGFLQIISAVSIGLRRLELVCATDWEQFQAFAQHLTNLEHLEMRLRLRPEQRVSALRWFARTRALQRLRVLRLVKLAPVWMRGGFELALPQCALSFPASRTKSNPMTFLKRNVSGEK